MSARRGADLWFLALVAGVGLLWARSRASAATPEASPEDLGATLAELSAREQAAADRFYAAMARRGAAIRSGDDAGDAAAYAEMATAQEERKALLREITRLGG